MQSLHLWKKIHFVCFKKKSPYLLNDPHIYIVLSYMVTNLIYTAGFDFSFPFQSIALP